MAGRRVIVAGAGVIGLTCAVRLAESGFQVGVLARDLPLETTSAVAGGHWGPFLAEPAGDVQRWARQSFVQMEEISHHPGSGIQMRTGHFIGGRPPQWAAALADVMPLTQTGRQAPGGQAGWRTRVPVADMPVYLGYLVRRLREAGGTLTRMSLAALPSRGLVINCTGLAARSLAADPSVRPIRGQVVITTNPGLTDWVIGNDEDDPGHDSALTYVFPQPERIVVGGTAEPDQWLADADPATARQILARATGLVPQLASARVLARRAALRPWRPAIRLETVISTGSAVVHCYGHGGCGITVSWGCAEQVLNDAEALSQMAGMA